MNGKKLVRCSAITSVHYKRFAGLFRVRSSKSLLANVLDIDDDFRCNHRCNTLPHNPTYYRTVYRQGEDGSVGPIGATDTIGRSAGLGTISTGGGRLHETVSSHTCLSSSAEYELALILKELRYITDQVRSVPAARQLRPAEQWQFTKA